MLRRTASRFVSLMLLGGRLDGCDQSGLRGRCRQRGPYTSRGPHMCCNAPISTVVSHIIVFLNGEATCRSFNSEVEMNTPRQPAVHYRRAPTHERIQHLLPRQAPGPRLILHLNPKKGASMPSTGNGAVGESGTGRREFPEIGHSM